ncbi:MAG: hypothetical protein LBS53_03800, partial [Synergistaceae bacterium]|nr:hypothetical protein [Synergistaceae bacterium]
MKISKKTRMACAAALALAALLPFAAERAAALLNLAPPIYTQTKAGVALDEDDSIKKGAEKANVLFLLDTGSTMTFSPNGLLPEVPNQFTGVVGNATPAQAAIMLEEATYGHGGLPAAGDGADRYGRDIDEDNNMKTGDTNLDNHANNYYSPFDYAGNKVAAQYGLADSAPLPYALVFKDHLTDWWQNGPPQGATIASNDLAPNDSRMYKMKLVLWRILSETVLLENLRFGMATTYQDANDGLFRADFYKVSPYGAGAYDTALRDANNVEVTWGNVNFQHGTGPDWSTGIPGSGGYVDSVTCRWGVNRDWYLYQKNTKHWKLVNRAYLRVPIREYSEEHTNQFRLWIDGFEDVRTNDANALYYFNNPELFGDGKTFLSTAIYSGHDSLTRAALLAQQDQNNASGIAFSHVDQNTDLSVEGNGQFLNFKKGSGEAVGSVLD